MPATPLQFERALLDVLRAMLSQGCHPDSAIDAYLSDHEFDEDDPSLWSDLRYACGRLFRLIVVEGGCRDVEALKLLALLGVSRAIRSEISVDWSVCEEPYRADSAIRTLLHTLRQSNPDEGLRWWRLYTMPWVRRARIPTVPTRNRAETITYD